MRIECRKSVDDKFKKIAKQSAPIEEYAVLLGKKGADFIRIEDLWVPKDVHLWATEDAIFCDVKSNITWKRESSLHAANLGLAVVGDIHTHVLGGKDRSPSEVDWELSSSGWVIGICCLYGRKHVTEKKPWKASTRFWLNPPKVTNKWLAQ